MWYGIPQTFPYEAPPAPQGHDLGAADALDPQEGELAEGSWGTVNTSFKALDDQLAHMTEALPAKMHFDQKPAAGESAGEDAALPVDPTLGYYKESDGTWVGFNGLGEMVDVPSDDTALQAWISRNP